MIFNYNYRTYIHQLHDREWRLAQLTHCEYGPAVQVIVRGHNPLVWFFINGDWYDINQWFEHPQCKLPYCALSIAFLKWRVR